jgi:AraC family transcriptional regulator
MGSVQPGQAYFGGKLVSMTEHSGVVLSEVQYPTAIRWKLHTHGRAFFALLLDGHYAESYRNWSWTYQPFTMGFHPEGMSHADECGVDNSRFFLIELEKTWVERLREYSPACSIEPRVCDARTGLLAARLFRESKRQTLQLPLLMEGLVLEILATMVPDSVSERKKPRWVAKVHEILQQEFSQKHTLEEIARRLDLHPVYLTRAFRKFTGESPGQCLNRVRVRNAIDRLANTEMSITEIALATGFSDQSHLTRALKQQTGVTPAAFRASLIGARPTC